MEALQGTLSGPKLMGTCHPMSGMLAAILLGKESKMLSVIFHLLYILFFMITKLCEIDFLSF